MVPMLPFFGEILLWVRVRSSTNIFRRNLAFDSVCVHVHVHVHVHVYVYVYVLCMYTVARLCDFWRSTHQMSNIDSNM
jgi:hypothetical protein